MTQLVSSYDLFGKRLFEHLNEFHDRGVIKNVCVDDNETVLILTNEGSFPFYRTGAITSEGIKLDGGPPRYALIK